jgi:zinc ribbon protein
MFCPTCGVQLAQGAPSCSSCGATLQKAPQAGEVGERAKLSLWDAVKSLRLIALRPVGGLAQAIEGLGSQRSLGAGLAFAVFSALCLGIGSFRLQSGFGASPGFGGTLGLLLLGFVPFLSMALTVHLARRIFRGQGTLGGDAMIAGTSLFPMGVIGLLACLLGFGNVEFIAVLFLFAICYTVLLLYGGCTQVSKLPEAASAPAVALILLLSGWFSKILYAALV